MFTFTFVIAYCLLYLGLVPFFTLFFAGRRPAAWGVSRRDILIIIFATVIIFSYTASIQDPLLENRLQHALGGGFLGFFVCLLAWRRSEVAVNRLQFFFFSLLLVITLGVGNEVLEYFLQTYTSLHFASSIDDTWLDLLSNTIGALLGGALFIPFIKKGLQLRRVT